MDHHPETTPHGNTGAPILHSKLFVRQPLVTPNLEWHAVCCTHQISYTYQTIMNIASRIRSYLRTTFQGIRKRLDIDPQWDRLRPYLRYLKVPLYVGCGFIAYPYVSYHYKSTKKTTLNYYSSKKFDQEMRKQGIPEAITKHVISNVLEDPLMHEETERFIKELGDNKRIKDTVKHLLINVMKDRDFTESALDLGKTILIEAAHDQEIQDKFKFLVTNVVTSVQVRYEVIELVKQVFSSQPAVDTLVDLLSKAINQQRLRNNITLALQHAFSQFLNNPETLDQIKIFAFYLIKEFEEDPEIKNIVNLVFEKGFGVPDQYSKTMNMHMNLLELQKLQRHDFEG